MIHNMGSLRSWPRNGLEVVDDKEGDGSSKRLIDFEVNNNVAKPASRHGSSASSSSSNSSQDLFNVLGNGDDKPLEKSELPELKPARAEPLCASFASATELSAVNNTPAGHAPGVYVPNRIPSSIFSSKPATPLDWSIASNESLFSIHVGNGSFSKDQFLMLYKSGELTKLDEQIIAQGNLVPPLKELQDMAARNEKIDKDAGATEMSKNKTKMVAETIEVAEDHSHQKMPPPEDVHNPINNTPTVDPGAVSGCYSQEKKFPAGVHNSPTNSNSGHSEESNNSTLSFAFPVFTGTTDAGTFSSVTGDQNNKGLQIKSVKKQQQEEQRKQKQYTGALQLQTPVSPQKTSSRSWFSRFSCCRCS